MNATESAKAKARSMSSPKIRPRNFNTCSERFSPYIRINSNPLLLLKWQVVVGLARLVISSKDLQVLQSTKSSWKEKDLSFNLECSLQILDRHGFR